MRRLGILLSGRGSNFLAIHRAIMDGRIDDAEIVAVISNKPDAGGLEAARSLGLPALTIPQEGKGPAAREAHDARMIATLTDYKVDLVCLAGYMRIVTPAFVEAFPNRILNIHPPCCRHFPGSTHSTRHSSMEPRWPDAQCTLWTRQSITASSCCRR